MSRISCLRKEALRTSQSKKMRSSGPICSRFLLNPTNLKQYDASQRNASPIGVCSWSTYSSMHLHSRRTQQICRSDCCIFCSCIFYHDSSHLPFGVKYRCKYYQGQRSHFYISFSPWWEYPHLPSILPSTSSIPRRHN